MDPIEKINIDKDTTFVLMLEAQKRGHEVDYMELKDLSIHGPTPVAHSCPVSVARANPHYQFGPSESRPRNSRLRQVEVRSSARSTSRRPHLDLGTPDFDLEVDVGSELQNSGRRDFDLGPRSL